MMNRDDPDTWTEADWNAYDDALDRLCSFKADQFARDLDRLGWKIVLQEPGDIGWIFAEPAIVDAPRRIVLTGANFAFWIVFGRKPARTIELFQAIRSSFEILPA
jgi:hypothetical protein